MEKLFMETFIERHNIEHYSKLLITETDPSKRAVLLKSCWPN